MPDLFELVGEAVPQPIRPIVDNQPKPQSFWLISFWYPAGPRWTVPKIFESQYAAEAEVQYHEYGKTHFCIVEVKLPGIDM